MRAVANMLLALTVAAGLVLPVNAGWRHDATCPDDCQDELLAAWEEFVSDDFQGCGPCSHPHDDGSHQHDEEGSHQHDGGDEHHHHHHHSCACGTASAWVVSECDGFTLHPPVPGGRCLALDHVIPPDSPVYLLDRPPMA